ncbi:hypothetical protein QJS10_CPA02g01540 [Acorus calamus]|uniref:Protein ENHANCED DISEASE RESISTANCE 2 C-terminal domain-containing protein n=1 Tax=Acorus calamus TaxID=4465 RepID=A0AAV9FGU9_ACOCL|nr:hypothetical protein QJS10_CPA02g01540 [Acorus calamus]
MCPTNLRSSDDSPDSSSSDWIHEAITGGSLKHVDLNEGVNGWASPPGDLFSLRGLNYFTRRQKSPSGDWLLNPAGVDWLRSPSKLDDVLGRPDNRIMSALKRSQCSTSPPRIPIPPGSLFYRFVHGDDAFRNERFKIVNRIVKGPWIVKAAVGNYAACLLGKALTCHYHRGENYLEIDVDIGSSAIANAILHLALGCVTAVTIDMGFLVEAQAEEELPERLLGAVRVAQMEMSSATFVDVKTEADGAAVAGGGGGVKGGKLGRRRVNHHHGRHTTTLTVEENKDDLDAINLMISTVMASGMAEEFGEDERMAGITVFALTDAAFVWVDT